MPRVNPNVNHELWVIVMCQCGLIHYNKCTTLVGEIEGEGRKRDRVKGGQGEGERVLGAGKEIG